MVENCSSDTLDWAGKNSYEIVVASEALKLDWVSQKGIDYSSAQACTADWKHSET